jgi:DNA-binding transcriptional regulator YiaG
VTHLSAIRYPDHGFAAARLHPTDKAQARVWVLGTSTSSGVHPNHDPDGLVSTILLFGFGFTTNTAAAETARSLRVKARTLGQLTSAGGEDVLGRVVRADVATAPPPNAESSRRISDIRLRTGLTWDQMARLFGVSRRTVHLWASGAAMSSAHEEHLHRLFSAFEGCGLFGIHGSWAAILFTAAAGGNCPFDMLATGRYEEAARELRLRAPQVRESDRRIPDASVYEDRRPLSPAVLLSALPDPGPPEPRRTLRAQVRRVKRDA